LTEEAVKNISSQDKHTLAAGFVFFWRILAATSVDEQKKQRFCLSTCMLQN